MKVGYVEKETIRRALVAVKRTSKEVHDAALVAVKRTSLECRGAQDVAGDACMTCVNDRRGDVEALRRAFNGEERDDTLQSEVNYDVNPTYLYRHIEAKEWKKAMARIRESPGEASTWIYRLEDQDMDRIRWRLLPIHSAIVFHAPVQVVEALIDAYPEGTTEVDDQSMTPLHLTCRMRNPDEAVVRVLLDAFPRGVLVTDKKGRTPLHVLESSKNVPPEYKCALSNLLAETGAALFKVDSSSEQEQASEMGVELAYKSSKSTCTSFDDSAYWTTDDDDDMFVRDDADTESYGDMESGMESETRTYEDRESGMETETRAFEDMESGMESDTKTYEDMESGMETYVSGIDEDIESGMESDSGGPDVATMLGKAIRQLGIEDDIESGMGTESETDDDVESGAETESGFDETEIRSDIEDDVETDDQGDDDSCDGYDSDGKEENEKHVQNTDESKAQPKAIQKLLVHGLLPSGRPLVYERQPDEAIEFHGVLPSGRTVPIDEKDADIMSQTLSFASSPRSPSNHEMTPNSNPQQQLLDEHVPEVLKMSFPVELGLDRSCHSEATELAGNKGASKACDAAEDEISSDDSGILLYLQRMEVVENSKSDHEEVKHGSDHTADGQATSESALCSDSAQPIFEVNIHEAFIGADGPNHSGSTFLSDVTEDKLEVYLVEPKAHLKNLLLLIACGRSYGDTDKDDYDDLATLTAESSQSLDLNFAYEPNTVPREERLINQTRRENACGALKTMAINKAGRGKLARTKGVIPTLSAALCDTEASFDLRQRCISTLIYLSQNAKACGYMLHFKSLPIALVGAINDESPEIRHSACVCLASLAKFKPNRSIIAGDCEFLDSGERIMELASAFDPVKPKRASQSGPTLHAIKELEPLECVLSDVTRDEAIESFDSANANESNLGSSHGLYFSARTSTLKILLDISNVPSLTKAMAGDLKLMARLIKSVGNMKQGENLLCIAILTNLTRLPENATNLTTLEGFLEAILAEADGPEDERRKCALYALQNLTCEKKPRVLLGKNKDFFHTMVTQYFQTSNRDIRLSILNSMRNLSNDPQFLLILGPSFFAEVHALIKGDESGNTVERYLACDISANLSRWLLSSSDAGLQTKLVQLGATRSRRKEKAIVLQTHTWEQWN